MLKIGALLVFILIGCASNIAPGTLKDTIRNNEIQRVWVTCMQQDSMFPAELRRICRREIRYTRAMWAWEDCVNEGLQSCSNRPSRSDIL